MDKTEIIRWLESGHETEAELFQKAVYQRNKTVGNTVHLRGLIEISNLCRKNCLYCGIRKSNSRVKRYELTDQEILSAARFAWEQNYGSIVLQGGERTDSSFVLRITRILKEIKHLSNQQLGITLSLGEQNTETYKRWFDAGAHRYLLRIETSNPLLYQKIHPNNPLHTFSTRLKCIENIQKCGYQTGSGVMIGLPFQTTEDLASDLLFLKSLDMDMVGMGPYLEHNATPLYTFRHLLPSLTERFLKSLRMIACLRLLMPDINIAATTALQAIDPVGREKALAAGANIVMPNITPGTNRKNYKLYPNKPSSQEGAETALRQFAQRCETYGCLVSFKEWGDSRHWRDRQKPENP